MEAFLTTLPPYVHEYLNKHPPTDVFNLLRELICFAVLYTEDRNKLNETTQEFLDKRQLQDQEEKTKTEEEKEKEKEEIDEQADDEAVVPESAVTEEEEQEEKADKIKEMPTYNIRTGEMIQTEKTNMPNTFPEWWGHQEVEPKPKPERKQTVDDKSAQAFGPAWISWENQPNTSHGRLERARSQIIPDLRSYLVEDSKMSTSHTMPPSLKKRNTIIGAPVKSKPGTTTSSTSKPTNALNRRISSPPICESPIKTVLPASKFIQTANKQQQIRQSREKDTHTATAPTRSASVVLKPPRQNAAMRARAEHARQQQEEMDRKKNTPPVGSSISLKLKQRVNSGIDWESIKRDRRKTVAEPPVAKKE